jgi:UDP-3-O-[3-hydroxymyristoyl] N-acetylglucosamine deacetylase
VTEGIRLEGYALHTGMKAAVKLSKQEGPITLGRGHARATLDQLRVAGTDGAVRVTDGHGLELELVEHFLAAVGGLGIREGVAATVDGPEFPLLDGGSRELADGLSALSLKAGPATLFVARSEVVTFGASSYTFEVGHAVELSVEIDFAHPAIGVQRATWAGNSADFRERIAGARTFGFGADAAELRARGRARLCFALDPGAQMALRRGLVAYGIEGVMSGAVPPAKDEAARHKLLDLIGDLALYGGPPEGRIVARCPGHTATHHIVRQALGAGVLCRR